MGTVKATQFIVKVLNLKDGRLSASVTASKTCF